MNKREKMYADIQKHGQNLLAIFPAATEQDPVKLAKKLHSLENKAHRLTERLCNSIPDAAIVTANAELDKIGARVRQILGIAADAPHVFVNHDPRGYALKIKGSWLRDNNHVLYCDWGGYGILAPDFND